MKKPRTVREVVLTNRGDCCGKLTLIPVQSRVQRSNSMRIIPLQTAIPTYEMGRSGAVVVIERSWVRFSAE
jgi:hypothetical protein